MNNFIKRIKYVKLKDVFSVIPFLIAILPSRVFKNKRPNLWLICEDENEARDNAYWFFKYTREKHPETDIVYAINRKSPDYQKIYKLGEVIQYGSLLHWIYYLSASKLISSQKGGKPNAALCYLLEIYGLIKNKRIYLKHGICINDLKWQYYEVTKYSLFVCAARKEYDFVKTNFHYPDSVVKLLGLCRYDNLNKENTKKNQILIMPTWRDWIARPVKQSNKYDDISEFTKTEYFKCWNSLLNNTELHNSLAENDLTVIFFPHRNMQKYLFDFTVKTERIIIANWQDYDVQTLLNESIFLITDYSSISMDFAYMYKPLVYYQFDQEKYRTAQYQEGYFSYHNNGFGEVITNELELITVTLSYIKSNFAMKDIYSSRVSEFFCFTDRNNCKRNFEAVYNL